MSAHVILPAVSVPALDPGVVEIDLDGVTDDRRGIRYWGKAKKQFDGTWQCLAVLDSCLCLVEVTVKPLIDPV